MSGDGGRVVYVNGAWLQEAEAKISVFDRGFLFGDGVYEVTTVLRGKLVDNVAHLARLQRSLTALSLPRPIDDAGLTALQRELARRNALEEGLIYLQVTRGAADRSFDWPETPAPSLVMFTQAKPVIDNPRARTGISVALLPDLRWKRRDIKTVCLLPASWAKQQAAMAGADDAWMVEDGLITEGSSNNAFIIGESGVLATRSLGPEILPGITRVAVLRLAAQTGLEIQERGFSPAEAKAAKEAFSTSASGFVMPVVRIDGDAVGEGRPGPIATRLRELYIETALAEAD